MRGECVCAYFDTVCPVRPESFEFPSCPLASTVVAFLFLSSQKNFYCNFLFLSSSLFARLSMLSFLG